MTQVLPTTGPCRCGDPLPCGCEWAEYGQYGIDSSYPGHPASGRCLHCKTQIAGKALRVDKWIYCDSRCRDARLITVPMIRVGGATYLPSDVVDHQWVSELAYYPAGWSR